MIQYIVFLGLLLIAIVFTFSMSIKEKKIGKKYINPYDWEYRKCESPMERKLFNGLRSRDYFVTTQYNVGRYRLDMAILNLKIAIEADGKAYHSSPKQKAHDRKRDKYLRSQGWKVLRFSGSQIHNNLNNVLNRIDKEVNLRSNKHV